MEAIDQPLTNHYVGKCFFFFFHYYSNSFSKDFKVKLLLKAEEELKSVEDEYETLCVEHKKLQKRAEKFAKTVVRGAFCVAAA